MIDISDLRYKVKFKEIKRISNVSDDDYFGEEYKRYVSNSSLKHLNPDEGGSAYNYINRRDIQSNSIELGSAVHRAVLEGDKYVLAEVDKPSGKGAEVIERAYAIVVRDGIGYEDAVALAAHDCDYYKGALTRTRIESIIESGREYFEFLKSTTDTSNLIILPLEQREKFLKAIASINENKQISELINPSNGVFDVRSFSEDVLIGVAEITYLEDGMEVTSEIDVKCKIDNWSIDLDNKVITINDLKTTSYAIQNFMGKWVKDNEPISPTDKTVQEIDKFLPGSFQKYHYHRQMSMYVSMLINHCVEAYLITDLSDWTINVNMIVAETVAPFNAYTFVVPRTWLEAGDAELRRLLSLLAWYQRNGFDKIIEFDERSMECSGSTLYQE